MRRLRENYSNQNLLRYGIISAFTLCIFFSLFYWFVQRLEQTIVFDAEPFNNGWSVTIGDEHFEDVCLTDFSFPVVSTGTCIIMENRLPEFYMLHPVLRIYTLYCTADIYLNNKLVYRYGHDLKKQSKNVGCGSHVTSLNNFMAGAPVKIILDVTEQRSFTSLQPVWIESAEKTVPNMLSGRLFMMFSSLFLMILGLISSVVLMVFLLFEKPVAKILSLSQTLLWLGIFELYSNRCVVVFFFNYTFNSWMEHVTLYCTNFAVLSLFYTIIAKRQLEKRFILFIAYAFAIYCALILLLDFSGIMHLPTTRSIQFVFLGVEVVFCLYVCIRNLIVSLWSERLPTMGFLFMLFFIVIDILRYPIQKYLSLNVFLMQGSPLSFGVLGFVTIMVLSFLFQIRPDSEKKAIEQLREEHIRIDYQTGFLNSFALNEYLRKIESADDEDFSVILLNFSPSGRDTPDLFSLDSTEVFNAFTGCIKKIFKERAKIAYTDTYEFSVVALDLRKEDIHRMLVNLDDLLFAEIQKYPRYQYSLSSGVALRSEVEYVSNLLPLAKERMQAHKEGLRN